MLNRIALLVLLAPSLVAQTFTREQIAENVSGGKCMTLRGAVVVCGADYTFEGANVEALTFRPEKVKPGSPALLLIPGYRQPAITMLGLASRLATEGFISMAVTQPGFGKSGGVRDYVGPATMRVLSDALDRTKKLPHVDPKCVGVYGHSRGGMAASLLAVRREDLRASVLAAGIYDFLKGFCEAPDAGIRDNMALETGMRDEAIRVRSSILEMDKLRAPILLLHGEKDVNVNVGQAIVLRDRLTKLGKPFEVHIYPDLDHFFSAPHVTDTIVAFLKKNL